MVDSSAPLVFDISSDDDDEDPLRDIGSIDSNYDWISDLFTEDEGEEERDDDDDDDRDDDDDDDDDDVVVVDEVMANPEKKRKKVDADDDVDDDCLVLEGDPDKPVEVERDGNARDDEDLVITSEKGQIACRDYPHARHLCAKFLFASTPHEQHCYQCHCYVCDSLAPCIYWGSGSSDSDHCHSTDQDPLWKAQREKFKQGNKAPLPHLLPPDTSLLPPPPPPQTVPVPMSPQNQVARLSAINACSTATNSIISNLNLRQSSISAEHTFPNNMLNPHLVSQQLLDSCNNSYVNQNVGMHTPSNLGPQYMNHPRIFKRQGSDQVVPPNSRYGHGSMSNNNVSRFSRNLHTSANSSKKKLTYQQQHPVTGSHSQQDCSGISLSVVPPSLAQVNRSNSYVGSVPCQPQTFKKRFGRGTGFKNAVSCQQSSLQTNMASTFANPMPPPSQGISQPNVNCFQNLVPSQWQVYPQLDTGGSFSFPPSVSCSQPNTGINNFENAASLPSQAVSKMGSTEFISPLYSQGQPYNQPNYLQQGKETLSAMNPCSGNYFPSLVGPTNQYNGMDSFPTQDPVLSHQPSRLPQYDSLRIPENTNNQCSYFAEPDPWMGDSIYTDGFDIGSPEVATVDAGSLLDY